MVRETRHLWVGNLPENVSKERIKEYFNRYGPVQSVRSLPCKDGKEGEMAGLAVSAVTVAFMDIKSACKALQTAHKLDERLLKTDFYDPTSGACGSGSCPPTPEEKGGGPGGGPQQPTLQGPGKLDHSRSSQHSGPGHYYRGHGEREYGGRGPTHTQHPPPRYPEDFRHRSRPPYRSGGPFNQEGVRGNSSSYRSNYGWKDSRARPEQTNYNSGDKCDQPRLVSSGKPVNGGGVGVGQGGGLAITPHKKKHRTRKSRSSESGSDSQQSGSNSRSSSSSSSRSSSSGSGSSKSPSPDRSRLGKGVGLGNYLPHTEFDKLCTIVVRNLPERPTESAVKEELSREYKKGGCVVRAVRIVEKRGQGQAGRTAVITFSDPADVSKALEDSRNKRIFGSLIDVEKLNAHADDRPRDGELSEFHAKATRTLFVGNISREVLPSEIHERFKEFGEILEIDIKKPDYALVQFVDIRSVVKAIRAVDGELIASQRVRLAFGLSVATKCVWCDGVGPDVTEKMLQLEFSQYGKIQDLIIDRSRGHALVYFDQLKKATIAVSEMRGRSVLGSRLQTDYASHECRAAFFDHCKKSGMDIRERAKPWEQEPDSAEKRADRSERLQRDKSNESRGSGTSRVGGRKRDEYDEELRRFQNERGKIENETERCFTPPYVGSRRGVAAGGPSRSPSPPRGASGPSPGQQSRSGIERTFSDRESVVSDGSRHGSPVSRESWRGSRYKPRTQAISPPGDSRSPADPDTDSRRGSKRYRTLDNGDSSEYRLSRGRVGGPALGPQDPRIEPEQAEKKGQFKLLGVDSGLSEDTSSGSSGSVPDVDNAKLLGRSTTARRSSTDSAVSRDESSRPPTPSHAPIPVYTSSSSLLRVVPSVTDCEGGLPYGAPRTPVSPPPSSDGSRPGTPLCDENPENLMSRSAAAPVRLASHLRQQNSSEPMSLPLPRFAQHVLSTSPGERSQRSLQISPREPRTEVMSVQVPGQAPNSLKQGRPELTKLSIMSPTKFGPGSGDLRARDPRLKSPSLKSPGLQPPLKSPVSVPGGSKSTFLSPEASPASSLTVKVGNLASDCKPKDPRLVTGLLTVAVPCVTTASPASPSPRHSRPRTPPQPPEQEQPPPQPVHHPVQQVIPTEKEPKASDPSDSLDERLKLLDEKYEAWSGLTRLPGSGSNRQDQTSRFNLDMKPAQPSAIVQKLLSRKSVFDEDTKRLEKKYEAPDEEKQEGAGSGAMGSGYNTISTLTQNPGPAPASSYTADSPLLSADSPVLSLSDSNFQTSLPREIPTMPLNSVSPIRSTASVKLPPQLPLRQPNMSPSPARLYFSPQIQSPKALDDSSSRPLPLPSKVGTPATSGTIPIKPLVDKLSKPAAFTKPSATVTPTLKSTGLTASSVRPIVFTTTSTKTVSTCTMAPSTHPHLLHTSVEKGEASSTTCSPKPDSALSEVSSTTALVPPQETDSDPNVTSTTGIESKKKLDMNKDIKTIKKEFDSLTSFKEKKDLVEESLFTPTATIMQAVKPKYDKKDKRSSSSSRMDIFNTMKDVKRAKDNLHKDKIKSNKEKKDKMKVKQKNDLKDFLSATATIRKEAKREKEEKKEQEKRIEVIKEDKNENKRRLSIHSEVEDSEPKSKIPKLNNDCETEIKKVKTEPMKPMGRIPKLEKKEEKRERTDSVKSQDGSKEKHRSLSKSDSRSKSKHDDRHRHRSSEKQEERNKEKHKKKKKEKDKDKEKEEKSKKLESKSRSHSTDEDKHHKKMKKSKDFKKRDEKKSKSDRKDKNRDRDREKDRDRDKDKHRDKEKERERKRKKEEEERKKMEHARKKKRMEDSSNSENSDDSSEDEMPKYSIFDEPVFDENNPTFFSMYDKVKARRSCVKAREEEEARRQEEALNKFAKLKAQRAKREEKKKSVDSDDESMSEDEEMMAALSRQNNSDESDDGSEEMTIKKKTSSLIRSSSESDIGFKSNKSKKKKKSRSGASSGEDRKRSFKPKRAVVDSSDDSSQTESRKASGPRPTPNIGLDSSESDDNININKSEPGHSGQASTLPKSKLHIYTDSDSEEETPEKMRTKSVKTIKSESDHSETDRKSSAMAMLAKNKAKSAMSDSESEPNEPKSSALAVLAKNKKKSPKEKTEISRPVVKSEPITSDSEQDVKNSPVESMETKKEIKKEIKVEKETIVKDSRQSSVEEKPLRKDKDSRQSSIEEKSSKKDKDSRQSSVDEKSFKKDKDSRQSSVDEKSFKKDKKKHLMKKEKRRDKEPKENFKEKSLLGQKLKMAKIFGTSSEDESTTRNSKPPTPNTSASKHSSMAQIPVKGTKLNVDQVFSDSEPEKQVESPALESDSDDGLPSRPPTPSFPATKTEEPKVLSPPKAVKPDPAPITVEQVQDVKPKTKQEEVKTKARTETRENSRDLFNDSTDEEVPSSESRPKSKKDKERNRHGSAHDRQKENENLFDSLLTVNVDLPSRSAPRKSPGGTTLKSPGCLKSPSLKSPGKSSTPTVSPGSHRSPMISPGGKPTYLLAHMHDKAASREAEKIHRAQEREMQKRGSDKVSKESFKTKKDFPEVSSKKGEDSSNKLSKTKEERKVDDASENLNKTLDSVIQKPLAKSERKSESYDHSTKTLIQTKEKKIDTDNLLEAESKSKEVYISQEKKSDINVSLKESKLEMDLEQINEKPEIKVKENLREGTNLDKNFKEESVSLCLSESDSDSNSVKDLDMRKPNEAAKISSSHVKENARAEVSRNQDGGINKVAVSDGKCLAKTSKPKETKVKSDDVASDYKKPKDKATKESVPEHKKLSISAYHEARKSKEMEMSRKAKESAKNIVQVDDSEKTSSPVERSHKEENKIKDKDDVVDSPKIVKAFSSYLESNSHKLKENAVEERRSQPSLDPSKKEVERTSANINPTSSRDNQDTRFKHFERSSKAEEDVKPILTKETVKSIKAPELKESDQNIGTTTTLPKREFTPDSKKVETHELAEEKPKIIAPRFEDSSMGKSVSVLEEKKEISDLKSLGSDSSSKPASQPAVASPVEMKSVEDETIKTAEVCDNSPSKSLPDLEFKSNQHQPDSEESADDSMSLVIDLDNKAPVLKEKTSVFDFDDELEENFENLKPTMDSFLEKPLKPTLDSFLEKPLKPTLDSVKKPLAAKEPFKSSAAVDILSSANKLPESTETTSEPLPSAASPKPTSPRSPSYALFASGTQIEATSSPSPVSEYEEGALVILADEPEKKSDLGNSSEDAETPFSKPASITRRKLSDYVPPEEQVILEKVTAVDPAAMDKQFRTPEPSEQEQLEKSIASITGDIPADSDLSNFIQTAPEPELVVKRTVISQEETESAVNALLGESFESFEENVEAAAPQPVETHDDDPMNSCADDEAAAAVAGLATEMSPDNNEDWHRRMGMHQDKQADKETVETAVGNIPGAEKQEDNDESIENIAAEIRRSSIENDERRASIESKESDVETVPEDLEEESPSRIGRGRGRGGSTPRRGRSAASIQPSPPSARGRGRGGRVTRGQARTESESSGKEGGYESEKSEGELGTPRGRGRGARSGRGVRGGRRMASLSQSDMDDRKSHDVFDFQESDEESAKAAERSKLSGSSVDTVIEEVVKGNYEEACLTSGSGPSPTIISVRQNPPRGQPVARGRGKPAGLPQMSQSSSGVNLSLAQPDTISSTTTTTMSESPPTSVPAVSPVSHSQLPQSPIQPLRLSIEEKVSPSVSMTSPTSRSPKPRIRRSTGGKSRESEEESADTRQKINLILEQAKQEAERSAAAQHLPLVPMPGYRVAEGGIPMTALVSQAGSPTSQEVLIDPKTGHTVRLAAPASVTLTLVTSTPSPQVHSEGRAAVITNTAPRAGIPQPTVLPPRHDQQVRPAPRMVAAPVRPPVVSGPRPPLPIQLPTQPLPPESVRKAQPVLLEQNQPTKLATVNTLPRTAIPVSLPTEPVPRSVANQMPNLPRTPLPFSSAHMVTSRQLPMTVTSQATLSRHLVTTTVTRPAPCPTIVRPQHAPVETGQRVSLGKRPEGTKEYEMEMKPREPQYAPEPLLQPVHSQAPVKVQRDYLQPRERETHRPASTPISSASQQQQQQQLKEEEKPQLQQQQQQQQQHVYPVPRAAHMTSTAQQYDAQSLERSAQTLELIRLANYRELTMIYQQLLAAGHPEHMAHSLAQSMVRDRFIQESVYRQGQPVHEEPRPGSVPPGMVHHLEEIRIQQHQQQQQQQQHQQQQQVVRQPLPAHSGDPYRQSDSPLYGAHGVPNPYTTTPPSAHIPDPYRRPSATGEQELLPPAAHSGQQLVRLTQSPAISDYSTSRPASPAYAPISSDYRLPHLAAYPICWSGTLGLKNDMANVRMHYVSGNRDLARASLPGAGATLKIVQRMRLEDSQLDGVARKMETKSEHCMLLALPNGSEHEEIELQSRILRSNFITYLQLKSAAGIVNVSNEDNQPAYIVHVFPSCDFANENLARIAPNLLHRVADIEHLVIVIATVFDVNR